MFLRYNQLLVIWKKFPYQYPAGFLTYRSSYTAAFPVTQWHISHTLPAYSDEIVQDSHLFPFYLTDFSVSTRILSLFSCFHYTIIELKMQ